MLVWINGPFGGGKTQTAYELHRRLPGSVVCDPERVGFGLKRTVPSGVIDDFQDVRAWRAGVVETLDLTLRAGHSPVIVPMTVVDERYFAETVGRLRELGHDVRHFALLARHETVLRRLRERIPVLVALRLVRGDRGLRRESFAVASLDRCLAALRRPEFAEHLQTDDIGITEVVERIAASAGLPLAANDERPWRATARRTLVGVRHIRL